MGSRLSDSAKLAARCRRIGWRVERNLATGGWKVWPANGSTPQVIHVSYSTVGSIHRITSTLDREGLSEQEVLMKNARITETRSRAVIARQAAEEEGKRIASRAAISKAAGPYFTQAEDVELEWFTKPHPAPWMRWANITPEIADHILKHNNGDNRPIGPQTVDYYRDIILSGNWHMTHQGLAFDTRGLCQDGQHRLSAVVEAAKADEEFLGVPFAVFVGMPEENFAAIDEGKLRTARQLFGKGQASGGGEKHASILQTLVRLVHYLDDDNARAVQRLRLPNKVIINEFAADADRFRESADFASKHYRRVHTNAGSLAAAHYMLFKANGDGNDYVDSFLEGLVYGVYPGTRVMLDDFDPRMVYRSRMLDAAKAVGPRRRELSRSSLSQVGMLFKTWNLCIADKSPRTLYFSDTDPIPEIMRCIPGEGLRPNVFRTAVDE